MKDLVRKFSEKAVSKKGSFTLEVVLIIVLFVLVVAMALGQLGEKVQTTVETTGAQIEAQTECIVAGGTWNAKASLGEGATMTKEALLAAKCVK